MDKQMIAETNGWETASVTHDLAVQNEIPDGNPVEPVALLKPESQAVVKILLVGEIQLLRTQRTLPLPPLWMPAQPNSGYLLFFFSTEVLKCHLKNSKNDKLGTQGLDEITGVVKTDVT